MFLADPQGQFLIIYVAVAVAFAAFSICAFYETIWARLEL